MGRFGDQTEEKGMWSQHWDFREEKITGNTSLPIPKTQISVSFESRLKIWCNSHQMRTWSDLASWKTPEVLEELLPFTTIMEFRGQKYPQSSFQPLNFVPCFSNSGFAQSDGIQGAGGHRFQHFVVLGCSSWSIPVFGDVGIVLR